MKALYKPAAAPGLVLTERPDPPTGPDDVKIRVLRMARVLGGEELLLPPGLAAHQAMHDAVAASLHAMPARPVAGARPAAPPQRRELPARRRGYTQKASIGGHRIYIRTGEYGDGSLGELQIALPRESGPLRGMLDSVAAAVSLGLQHGVSLDEYMHAFTLTRFGPAGRVEGDADVSHATSPLDYVFPKYLHRLPPVNAPCRRACRSPPRRTRCRCCRSTCPPSIAAAGCASSANG